MLLGRGRIMTEIWRTKEIFVILASTIKNIDNVNYPMYPESQNVFCPLSR